MIKTAFFKSMAKILEEMKWINLSLNVTDLWNWLWD